MADELLLTAARLCTFLGTRLLTNASSFFFARGERLFLVTSRHVVSDRATEHYPDRIEIELHVDADNLAHSTGFSIPLYRNRKSIWRQGRDGGSEVDVAVIEIERAALPPAALYSAFTPAHLPTFEDAVEIGASLLVVGFPLGFHDTLHHMPVVRQAAVASAYGLRFQGQGYFLTDARTHRGTSGAPVVMRIDPARHAMPDRQRPAPADAQRHLSIDAQRDAPHDTAHDNPPGVPQATRFGTLPGSPPSAPSGAPLGTRPSRPAAPADAQRTQSEDQPGVPFRIERRLANPSASRSAGDTMANHTANPAANDAAHTARPGLAQHLAPTPVSPNTPRPLPWLLLGVHSSRLDVGSRDINLDEALGLNCAWYADILLKLTEA